MINSFMFLQAQDPKLYDNSLTTEGGTKTPTQSRNDLDASIAMPRLQGNEWNAKLSWVNKYAPGTAIFSAITSTASNSDQGKAYTQDRAAVTLSATAAQMWTWLTQQIKAGEDVELGIFNHMTTVMGYAVDTTAGRNFGAMYLEIIDPNAPRAGGGMGPGLTSTAPEGEWVRATEVRGSIRLSGFSVADYRNPYVYCMFSESAVPEPSSLILVSLAVATGVVCRVVSVGLKSRRPLAAAEHRMARNDAARF
jgi:hypothetical protein